MSKEVQLEERGSFELHNLDSLLSKIYSFSRLLQKRNDLFEINMYAILWLKSSLNSYRFLSFGYSSTYSLQT